MSFSRYILIASVIPLCLSACSDGDESEVPASIRLVDVIGSATVDSSVDLTKEGDREKAMLQPDRTLSVGSESTVYRDPWVTSLASVSQQEGGDVVLRLLPLPSANKKSYEFKLRLAGDEGFSGSAFLVHLDQELTRKKLGEKETVQNLMERTHHQWKVLERQEELDVANPAGRGVIEFSGKIITYRRASNPVLVMIGNGDCFASGEVELFTPTHVGRWWLQTSRIGDSPWAIRLPEGKQVTETLFFFAPGSLKVNVQLPKKSPSLKTVVSSLAWMNSDQEFDVKVGASISPSLATSFDSKEVATMVRVGGERGVTRVPIDLDLSALAGQEVEVFVDATAGPSDIPVVITLEAPVIEGAWDEKPMDVILISLDTLRADRMSLYGAERLTTPHLDALADSSLVFENAISTAPWTLPSHVSIFSGQYPDRHGVFSSASQIPPGLPWITSDFRRAGYQTDAFTASGYLNPRFGFQKGFERYEFIDPAHPTMEWAVTRPVFRGENMVQRANASMGARRRLLQLLEDDRDRPLFLFVHTYQSHEYHANPAVLKRFGVKEEDIDFLLDGVYGQDRETSPFLKKDVGEEEASRLNELAVLMYDATVVEADKLVGDIVAVLEETGRLDSTLIIVTSDHGEALMERGNFGHGGTVYEEQVWVPLLIRGPGVVAGRVRDVVSLVDLVPTLREHCDLGLDRKQVEPLEDGVSLAPFLRGDPVPSRAALSRGGEKNERDPAFRSVRGEQWKLILEEKFNGGERIPLLFNLSADPKELESLTRQEAEKSKRLLDLLKKRVEELTSKRSQGYDAEMSSELIKTLQELGYLGGS